MSAPDAIRVAVVGVGHLGRHHARILAGMPGVQLVGILDLNGERAQEIAAACGTAVLTELAQLPGTVDAVTIAVPTESHLAVALPLVEAGVPVLVEKPLARSVAEADRLLAVARARRGDGGRGPHGAFQSGSRRGAPAPRCAALHRGAPPRHVPGAQPRHRRRVRPDDPRSGRDPVDRGFAGGGHRCSGRAGADAAHRHCERPPAVCIRLHRESDGEPHQPRSCPQDPPVPDGLVHLGRLRRAGARGVAAGAAADRSSEHRRRQAGGCAARSR